MTPVNETLQAERRPLKARKGDKGGSLGKSNMREEPTVSKPLQRIFMVPIIPRLVEE